MTEVLNGQNQFNKSELLAQIFENCYDSIFVTDRTGTVVMANPAASRLLSVPHEKLIGSNVKDLVEQGLYDRSTVMEAIQSKKVVTGMIGTAGGINLMATSSPVPDEKGEVSIVITTSRDINLVDEFLATLEMERARSKRYKNEIDYLRDQTLEKEHIIARSRIFQNTLIKAVEVANVDSTVMLFGESGTGKEVIAKYIHRHSRRAGEPFIAVNCAAIPEALLESELFGYDKGAFSGANAKGKPGLIEIADKGTLFLDEIAELPLALQSKLLRVLETNEIRRLGSMSVHQVDVRYVGATNRDLRQMIHDKKFREDLYYRLNVIPIKIPPLRDRPEDIVALLEYFLADFNKKYGYRKYFSQQYIRHLMQYSWPGNVRELRNLVERLVITSPGDVLDIVHEEEVPFSKLERRADHLFHDTGLKEVMRNIERSYIEKVLQECGGHICEAARRLQIHRTVLYRKIHAKN